MIYKHKEYMPVIAKSAKIFPQAVVCGDVTIKENVNIWFNATVRGDMAPVTIGKNTNIQDNAVIHTNTGLPTIIGESVTIGHGAIIHAATRNDYALIGMGSIILDGAVVEKYAMVAAGCVVPPNKIVPEKMLAVGNPMQLVRNLTAEEIENNLKNVEHYLRLMREYE